MGQRRGNARRAGASVTQRSQRTTCRNVEGNARVCRNYPIRYLPTTHLMARTAGYQGGGADGSRVEGMGQLTHTDREDGGYGQTIDRGQQLYSGTGRGHEKGPRAIRHIGIRMSRKYNSVGARETSSRKTTSTGDNTKGGLEGGTCCREGT